MTEGGEEKVMNGIASKDAGVTDNGKPGEKAAKSNPPLATPASPSSSNNSTTANNDNPMPHVLMEGKNAIPLEVIGSTANDQLVIIMVGLPATGKTHIAKRICRYLNFFHDIPAEIFNVGDYRRQLCGAQLSHAFYHPSNTKGLAARQKACDAALNDMIAYLKRNDEPPQQHSKSKQYSGLPPASNTTTKHGVMVKVAAFDATNTTKERRQYILKRLADAGIFCKKIFVESICDSQELLEENIRKVKLSTPDYRDADPKEAMKDFLQRRENYLDVYEAVDESDGPHVKIVNCKKFIVHNIRGYLPLKVVHFCMNLHTLPRTFYLTRHGQSEYNVLGKIGGDSGLSPKGIEYAQRLAFFCKDHIAKGGIQEGDEKQEQDKQDKEYPCRLWTSTLRRTKETAQFIQHNQIKSEWDNGDVVDWVQFRPMAKRNLDELYAGTCDGLTYKEIEEIYPEEFARRQDDKLAYRYPRGESYMDVTLRLEPLAQEMERVREPVLIVAHQGILRILYAYFMGLDRKDAPYVSIPLNNVIQLTPHAYGCHETRFCLMQKEEMVDDGQDEPVTSMPVKQPTNNVVEQKLAAKTESNGTHNGGTHSLKQDDVVSPLGTNGGLRRSLTSKRSNSITSTTSQQYDNNDPIMNAPSC